MKGRLLAFAMSENKRFSEHPKNLLIFLVPLILVISIFSISLVAAAGSECNFWCRLVALFTGKLIVTEEISGYDSCDIDGDHYEKTAHPCHGSDCIDNSGDCSIYNGTAKTYCQNHAGDIHPGAAEKCNGVDDNCNGQVDENLGNITCGLGVCAHTINNCVNGQNQTCNPMQGASAEICDGLDNDCDGQIDEGVKTTFYLDSDSDTYGDSATSVQACSAPSRYVTDNTDCNDLNSNINPGINEVCNGIDDNCIDGIDENNVCSTTDYYCDDDNDTFIAAIPSGQCNAYNCIPSACIDTQGNDCNDGDASVNPGMAEVCDGIDNNCNGQIDEGAQTTFYYDSDSDTYGDINSTQDACSAPSGYVTDNTDCNDLNNQINPGMNETCNGLDDNCDGNVDEGRVCSATDYYCDDDNDTFIAAIPSGQCNTYNCISSGCVDIQGNDCNDTDTNVNPNATEICDGLDNNCNAQADEGCPVVLFHGDRGGAICPTDWRCGEWGQCSGGTQTRTCRDINSCRTNDGKPDESRTCEMPPLPAPPLPAPAPEVPQASLLSQVLRSPFFYAGAGTLSVALIEYLMMLRKKKKK